MKSTAVRVALVAIIFCLVLIGDAMAWNAKGFKKPDKMALKHKLTEAQYQVTQEEGTEPAFNNQYVENHRDGIYVDVISGEPLFSSLDKYESGSGWPSFGKPLVAENIVTKTDHKLATTRTEVRSKHADSHLGHVFDDHPNKNLKRYCMNSSALRFIPAADLEKEGYPEFMHLFNKPTIKPQSPK